MSTLLSINQFAERAGISRSTIYREIRAGRLPVRRFGASGRIRIPASALEAAVEAPPAAPRKKEVIRVRDRVGEYSRRKEYKK